MLLAMFIFLWAISFKTLWSFTPGYTLQVRRRIQCCQLRNSKKRWRRYGLFTPIRHPFSICILIGLLSPALKTIFRKRCFVKGKAEKSIQTNHSNCEHWKL